MKDGSKDGLHRGVLGAIAIVITIASCASPVTTDRSIETPESESDCADAGGEWVWYPMGSFHFCVIQTSDAGRACSDNRECQGDCQPIDLRVAWGEKARGQCAPTTPIPGGCPAYLIDGRVEQEPCI